MSTRLRSFWLLLTDPGEWSARRYARKNTMELTALHPEKWRRPARDPVDMEREDEDLPENPRDAGGDPR